MHRDAADHHHVAARVLEAVAQHLGGVEFVAAEQPALPELAHALRGAAGVGVVGGDAAGTQQVADGFLEGGASKAPRRGMPTPSGRGAWGWS